MDDNAIRADECHAWRWLAALCAFAVVLLAAAGFTVRPASLAAPLTGAAILSSVAAFYRYRRPDPRMAATCTALAQLVLCTMAAGPLSYVAATADRPYSDTMFAAADGVLGLDWRGLIGWVAARPECGALLKIVYDTLMPQLALALVALGFSGRLRDLRMLVWAVGIAALAAIVLSALVPALGYYVHLRLAPAAYAGLDPSAAFVHLADITGLRDGSLRRIDLATLEGIITFPSFHATLAALFGWAFWQHRLTRWPGIVVEGLMLVATPVHGGHYFVDVIAGVTLALAGLAVAAQIVGPAPAVAIRSSPCPRSRAASAP